MGLQQLDRALSGRELEELDRFLAKAGVGESSMDLYSLDGFLTALVSGPRAAMPSQWVPWVWDAERGETGPEFETLEQARRIFGLLMRHINSIARTLMRDPGSFEPLLEDGDEDTARSWCVGFLSAMRFDPSGWGALVAKNVRWFAPILGLAAEEGETARSPDATQIARWTKAIAPSVAKIHAFCLEQRLAQPKRAPTSRFPASSRSRSKTRTRG